MENKEYTVAEVIAITSELLSQIEVPVELIEKIGIPIARCISNLRSCTEVIMKAQQKDEKETEKDGADNGE